MCCGLLERYEREEKTETKQKQKRVSICEAKRATLVIIYAATRVGGGRGDLTSRDCVGMRFSGLVSTLKKLLVCYRPWLKGCRRKRKERKNKLCRRGEGGGDKVFFFFPSVQIGRAHV